MLVRATVGSLVTWVTASSCAINDDYPVWKDACFQVCYWEPGFAYTCGHFPTGVAECERYSRERCEAFDGLYSFKYVVGNCPCWDEVLEGHGELCDLGDWPHLPATSGDAGTDARQAQ